MHAHLAPREEEERGQPPPGEGQACVEPKPALQVVGGDGLWRREEHRPLALFSRDGVFLHGRHLDFGAEVERLYVLGGRWAGRR